jgi:hypothetical protein
VIAGEIMTTTAITGVATSITADTGTGTTGTAGGTGAGTTKHRTNENGGVRETAAPPFRVPPLWLTHFR